MLPVEGAPVVFSTAYAHDAVLHLTRKDGSSLDLPARADPARGGFVVSDVSATAKTFADAATASLHAEWGFDRYEGPSFKLTDAQSQVWSLSSEDSADRIVGRTDTIHMRAQSVSCLDEIILVDAAAKSHKVDWKKIRPNEVELVLQLQEVAAGELTLRVRQFGRVDPQTLALHAFAQAGHLESFTLHAGDTEGMLHGNRLDKVQRLTFGSIHFMPGTLSTHDGRDELPMLAQSGSDTRALKPGDAQVALEDGRGFNVKVSIDPPRPSAALIGKTVQWAGSAADDAIQLSNASELPLEARFTFSLRAQSPTAFRPDEKLEVATADGSISSVLSVGTGEVRLQSRKVAVVTLDPSKALGGSAFGPLQFRRILDGVTGGWTPLATLVRLPKFTGVNCPAEPDLSCSLRGADLFLLDSVSTDADFSHVTHVPDGFTEAVLRIPHPMAGRLYVKLRDDPAVINLAVINVNTPPLASTEPPSPGPEHLRARPPSEPTSEALAATVPARPPSVLPPSTPDSKTQQSTPQDQSSITAAKSASDHAH